MNFRTLAYALGVLFFAGASVAQAVTSPASMTKSDEDFVVKAITANANEIADAQSQLSSRDARVRAFAQRMMNDHTTANTQLVAYAEKENIKYPKRGAVGVTEDARPGAVGTHRNRSTGAAAAMRMTGHPSKSAVSYMREEIAEHKAMIDMLKTEVRNAGDPNLQAMASGMATVAEAHLKLAEAYFGH